MAWQRLSTELDARKLDSMIQEISLAEVLTRAPDILAGKVRGRLVVNINA